VLSPALLLLACSTPEPAPTAPPAQPQPTAAARFAGSAACGTCHPEQSAAWQQSRHRRAQAAIASTDLPAGLNTALTEAPGALDPALADAVTDRIGWFPLQQFLVPGDDGRLALLPLSWDARPADVGGQRWFLPQPAAADPADPLHWQGREAAWNLQCAECHVTGWDKGYDADRDRYDSTGQEAGVGCEACHGPGAAHIGWAEGGQAGPDGLVPGLASHHASAWSFADPDQRIAARDAPADPAATQVCAPCHARRSALVDDTRPGSLLADGFRLALPLPPLYFADGQQRDEVFEWASFQQSAMARAGVTCGDCHDPHSGGTRAEGDALCTRCHRAPAYATPQHHGHHADSEGARCVACHMPTRTYMAVDDRRDHRLARPRPDLAQTLDLPDPCTGCHEDRDAAWAAAAIDRWRGTGWRGQPSLAPLVADAATPADALLQAATDTSLPGLRRAALVTLAADRIQPEHLAELRQLATDSEPQVRAATLGALAPFPAEVRAAVAAPLLADPIRLVRISAADLIADIDAGMLRADEAADRRAALDELQQALAHNTDWDDFAVRAADLALRLGDAASAEATLRRVLDRSPADISARANLADLLREQGRDADAGALLTEGLSLSPDAAPLHFAQALWLVRQGRAAEALPHLEQAAGLDPSQPRYGLILAVALDEQGRHREAVEALDAALQESPADPELRALRERWRSP